MSSTRTLYESLSLIASTWPRDALRQESNFGQSILRAAERCLTSAPPSSAPPPQTSSSQGVSTRINSRSLEYRTLTTEEIRATESAIVALNAIKSGQASKKHPLPDKLGRPASNPEYYERLGRLLQRAANGEDTSLTFGQRIRIFFGMRV